MLSSLCPLLRKQPDREANTKKHKDYWKIFVLFNSLYVQKTDHTISNIRYFASICIDLSKMLFGESGVSLNSCSMELKPISPIG